MMGFIFDFSIFISKLVYFYVIFMWKYLFLIYMYLSTFLLFFFVAFYFYGIYKVNGLKKQFQKSLKTETQIVLYKPLN